jgi:hypothetical protein
VFPSSELGPHPLPPQASLPSWTQTGGGGLGVDTRLHVRGPKDRKPGTRYALWFRVILFPYLYDFMGKPMELLAYEKAVNRRTIEELGSIYLETKTLLQKIKVQRKRINAKRRDPQRSVFLQSETERDLGSSVHGRSRVWRPHHRSRCGASRLGFPDTQETVLAVRRHQVLPNPAAQNQRKFWLCRRAQHCVFSSFRLPFSFSGIPALKLLFTVQRIRIWDPLFDFASAVSVFSKSRISDLRAW